MNGVGIGFAIDNVDLGAVIGLAASVAMGLAVGLGLARVRLKES